jgi:antitoxin component YwqK of YwqJK toxin-antitoxin module
MNTLQIDKTEIKREYDNNILIKEAEYKNGKMNGKCNEYIRCGYLHPEIDTLENEWNYYLYKENNYTDNKLDGIEMVWYYKPHTSEFWINKLKQLLKQYNIQIKEDKINKLLGYHQYKNGNKDGIWITIDIVVDTLTVFEYKDGELLNKSKIKCWTSNGESFYSVF